MQSFLAQRGLQLSPKKNRISHINTGFDFLSQNLRKYNGKLFIKPAKVAIKSFKQKVPNLVHQCKEKSDKTLISKLNTVIRGWVNYRTFCKLLLTAIRETGIDGRDRIFQMFAVGLVPIRRHVKTKAESNPFDPKFRKYFANRCVKREKMRKFTYQKTVFYADKN